jgi:hypothetical protein
VRHASRKCRCRRANRSSTGSVPAEELAHLADVIDDAAAGTAPEALGHPLVVVTVVLAEGDVGGGVLRLEIDHRLVEIEDRRGDGRGKSRRSSRGSVAHVDPEFQRVLIRVLIVGGMMAALTGIGMFFAFRSFGDRGGNRRAPATVMFVLLAVVAVCCLILLRVSYPG